MTQVVVRGSATPCADLPTGVERTVEFTRTVKRRIYKFGYYELVRFIDDKPAVDAATEDADGSVPDVAETFEAPPALNASEKTWLEFLRRQPGVEVPTDDEGKTPPRDGLIAFWQQVSGGS